MPDDAKNEEVAAPEKGGKKVFLFSGVGMVVIIAAAFLFATFAVPAPPENGEAGDGDATGSTSAEGVAETPLEIFDVPVILVNVKNTNKKRVLKIHVNAMYETTQPEIVVPLFEEKLPEIKDTFTTLLTEKTLEELEGKDDLNALRIELLDEVNRIVFGDDPDLGEVVKLYYEEFLVQ